MGQPRTRTNISVDSFKSEGKFWGGGVLQSSWVDELSLNNIGWCRDQTNNMSLLGGGMFNIGGPFLSLQAQSDFPIASNYVASNAFGLLWEHKGPVIAYPHYVPTGWVLDDTWWISSMLDDLFTRIGLGATAISRCKPAQPEASLATSVAELFREGIPNSLRQFSHMKDEVAKFRELTSARKSQEAPSKFLEYQFGWKPLVSDIRKASRAILQSEKILEDLRRNSGKRMRRRYQFPATSTSEVVLSNQTHPWPSTVNAYVMQQAGMTTVTKTDTKSTWFAGEFVYTYPGVDASIPRQILAGARHLLGVDLTPETIWNVAPWTWLGDWFANVGDVVSNFTAIGNDNLVLRYGYLMQEAKREFETKHEGLTVHIGSIPSTIKGTARYTAKSRIAASPYGFGLAATDLDLRQLAILASIGITRL